MNESRVWMRYATGESFKVCITDCLDVADLIEAARNKLGLSERLDELQLFLMGSDGFKGEQQRPGKLITQLLEENYPAGRNDQHPLLIFRKVIQSPRQSILWSVLQCSIFRNIQSALHSEWNAVNWFTMSLAVSCFWDILQSFSLYSATFFFITLKIATYVIVNKHSSLEIRHFTCSWDNISQKRYWTLVSSSLAHADINHLLCNILVLAADGSLFESLVGFKVAVLFFCLASIVSSLISLNVHGHPSIGSSGVVYAINGILVRLMGFDWRLSCLDYILFHLATRFEGINHAAHAGGFAFGYLVRDIFLPQKQYYF